MTEFNSIWLLIGLLVGCAAGMAAVIGLVALGAAGSRRRERHRIGRTALAAWRGMQPLMNGWRPTREQLDALDAEPPQVVTAYRAIAEGWDRDDARWDVLVAVLTHARRESLRYRVDLIKASAEQAPPVRMVR